MTHLAELLASERPALVETVFAGVRHGNTGHYRACDVRVVRARIERLVDRAVSAISGDPREFAAYVRGITIERVREGYHLDEIQRVLSVLEAKGWEISAHRIPDRGELLRALSLLTETIGLAKDELARVYLEESLRATGDVARLEARIERLMSGTV